MKNKTVIEEQKDIRHIEKNTKCRYILFLISNYIKCKYINISK